MNTCSMQMTVKRAVVAVAHGGLSSRNEGKISQISTCIHYSNVLLEFLQRRQQQQQKHYESRDKYPLIAQVQY